GFDAKGVASTRSDFQIAFLYVYAKTYSEDKF
ncbi:MAG: hypothetical protein ACI8P9_002348, partial [Parasphingorhabdus sp.]